ncbi:MAG TPA: fasciclin domain-containing protein [Opitutales bacterium]|nr:fasciclin domain-containing protein [Opitutales bacterium]
MKKTIMTLIVASLALPAAALHAGCGACGSHSHDDKAAHAEKANIVETAVAAGSFETLVAAVKAAGLVETLSGEGPFTVFAPTDKAFAALPEGTVENLLKPENKDKLVSILTYHVVPAKVKAKDVKAGEAPTVNGKTATIEVTDGGVSIEGANVVKTDVMASNGVIHVIDKVIMP